MLLLGLAVLLISFSDGVMTVHGFGKICAIEHEGWHFHMHCDCQNPRPTKSELP